MSAPAERRAMVALVATFALLVQALVPSFAVASSFMSGAQVICTSRGQQVAAGDPAPTQQTHRSHCEHCLCAASVAVLADPPIQAARLSFDRDAPATGRSARLPPPPRGPPRPYGQGPPSTEA